MTFVSEVHEAVPHEEAPIPVVGVDEAEPKLDPKIVCTVLTFVPKFR